MKKSLGPKTIIFPTPVLVIGSYDKDSRPNAMTASWAGICSSQPPCVMVALRKATLSYTNLMQRKAFTINLPSERHLEIADYLGTVSGRIEDKFHQAGLTAIKSDIVDAPYIEDFPLVLECQVIQTVELGLHTQFIAEIKDVKAEEKFLDSLGLPAIEKIKPFSFAPESRLYFATGKEIGKAFESGQKIKERR